MAINYKILFEVKLLHEYYLTDKDGSTIFDKPIQSEKLEFLRKRFNYNYPSINDDLTYEVPASLKATFANNKLRLINVYSGFRVFASVKEEMLTGNIKAYKPSQSLPEDLPIIINLNNRNTLLDTLSNSSLKRLLPAKYYFSNRDLGGDGQLFPVLSRPLPFRDDTLQYEQGELALDQVDNLVKAFFFEKDGTINWDPVDAEGYVNTNDRSLLPTSFYYTFSKTDAVDNVTFVLKNNSDTTVSTLTRGNSALLSKVQLDFSNVVPVTLSSATTITEPLLHTLEVTGTNGFAKKHSILFCDQELLQPATWGLVHLQRRVTDPLFQLLDDDGLLITRKNADGSIVSHPVFEIRIKSRFAFWRYINNRSKKIEDNAALHPFLEYDAANGLLETKRMLNATYTPIEFIHLGTTQYLPNPGMTNLLQSDKQRVYMEIRVPESDLFKVL